MYSQMSDGFQCFLGTYAYIHHLINDTVCGECFDLIALVDMWT